MEIPSVTASALKILRDNIIIGYLKPGEKLNESDISGYLNISRPPLREAFRLLENENLVVNIPRRGTYVSEMSARGFIDIMQLREMIECYAMDLLKSARIKDLPQVKLSLDKALALPPITKKADPFQLLKRFEIVVDFHKILVESAGNPLLNSLFQSSTYELARYQFLYFQINGTEHHSLENHQLTLDLIKNGKYEKAKKKLKEHIHFAQNLMASTFEVELRKHQKIQKRKDFILKSL